MKRDPLAALSTLHERIVAGARRRVAHALQDSHEAAEARAVAERRASAAEAACNVAWLERADSAGELAAVAVHRLRLDVLRAQAQAAAATAAERHAAALDRSRQATAAHAAAEGVRLAIAAHRRVRQQACARVRDGAADSEGEDVAVSRWRRHATGGPEEIQLRARLAM